MSRFHSSSIRLQKAGGRLLKGAALALFVLFVSSYAALPLQAGPAAKKPVIAVSTTLLEAGVRDLYGDSVKTFRIMPPGACPGHYDMTPRDLKAITEADVVVLHAYQEHMGRKLAGSGLSSKPVVLVPEEGSMIVPEGYSDMLRFLSKKLPENVPGLSKPGARLEKALKKVSESAAEAKETASGKLEGVPVAAAFFQADFCRWLDMKVVAEIDAGSDVSVSRFHRIMMSARQGNAAMVVGNRQSGQKEYEVLAKRLDVPLVVLSNFPEADAKSPYRELLLSNVKALVSALPSSEVK